MKERPRGLVDYKLNRSQLCDVTANPGKTACDGNPDSAATSRGAFASLPEVLSLPALNGSAILRGFVLFVCF